MPAGNLLGTSGSRLPVGQPLLSERIGRIDPRVEARLSVVDEALVARDLAITMAEPRKCGPTFDGVLRFGAVSLAGGLVTLSENGP